MEEKQQETEKTALSEEYATQAKAAGSMTFSGVVPVKNDTGSGEDTKNCTAQGFAMNPNTKKCFLTMLYNNKDDKGKVARVPYNKDKDGDAGEVINIYPDSGGTKDLGHANDCTYYSGRIYIVQGNGKGTNIKSLNTSLKDEKTYTYTYTNSDLDMNYFNAICYQSGSDGWFILGGRGKVKQKDGTKIVDEKFVTAYLKGTQFVGVSYFTLEDVDSTIKIAGNTPQHQTGVVRDWAYYRIYNQKKTGSDEKPKKNTIVSYVLPGNYPSFSGTASYVKHYNNTNKDDKYLFEMEGLAFDEYANLYASANVQDTQGSALRIKIFKVTLGS